MIRSHFWHSFVAHPLMALCHLFGLNRLGDWCHDSLIVEPSVKDPADHIAASQDHLTERSKVIMVKARAGSLQHTDGAGHG